MFSIANPEGLSDKLAGQWRGVEAFRRLLIEAERNGWTANFLNPGFTGFDLNRN